LISFFVNEEIISWKMERAIEREMEKEIEKQEIESDKKKPKV
jgi:hypothetical protein